MRQQVTKLSAHVETLLDVLLDAHGRWALLRPILTERSTIAAWGGGIRKRALDGIRRSLMHVCVLDIAQISLDPDERSPSIGKIMKDLDVSSTQELLKADFVKAWAGLKSDTVDCEERAQSASRRFDEDLATARAGWAALEPSARLKAFKRLRDKNLAHVELMFISGRYETLKVDELGIKWKDIGLILDEIDPIVLALNSICRTAGFDMQDACEQFDLAARTFWRARTAA